MKLYVCWTTASKTLGHTHACGLAYDALVEAGHDPEVVLARGWGGLPPVLNRSRGRREVRELSGGSDRLPALLLDDGELIQESQRIIAWAEANPARSPSASA